MSKRSRNRPPPVPPRPPRWYDGIIGLLPEGAARDVREMSNAPRAIVGLLLLGIGGGWFAASRFYAERFTVMEERVKQAQEQAAAANADLTRSVTTNAPTRASALVSWGGDAPRRCQAQLDRSALMEYARTYEVAVACGARLANLDRFTDPGITLSEKYTLADGSTITISVPASPTMASALLNFVRSEQAKLPLERRPQMRVNLSMWYEVLLIPKTVSIGDIRTLADLARLGGMVAPNQGKGVRVSGLSPAVFQ
jgi:hypothetical protein